MAKAKELESIKLLVGDEESRENTLAESITPNVDSAVEAQDALAGSNVPDSKNTTETQAVSEKDSKEKKTRRRKGAMKNEARGISSKSPIVRLLDEEKRLIKRLEAHILLETGETVTDHLLIMAAVREYAKKHYPDFQ